MGKGSSGTKTTYTASPEQRKIFAALLPMFQNLGALGAGNVNAPNMGAPSAPYMPSMSGVRSGVSPYQTFGYEIPSLSGIMPTTDWWGSIAPEIKAGAWAPFEEGQNRLMETLGASGVSGSARGGYSGATGAALGEYMADATPAYAMNLWNMTAPGAMAGWQAGLGQNQYMAGLQNQQSQMQYQNVLGERERDYSNTMARLGLDYDVAKQAWGIPFGLTGMMPSTFSQGITTQPQNNFLNGLGGAAGGAILGGATLGPLGALGGGLMGGLGGK